MQSLGARWISFGRKAGLKAEAQDASAGETLLPKRVLRRFARAEAYVRRSAAPDALLSALLLVPVMLYGAYASGAMKEAGHETRRLAGHGIAALGFGVSEIRISGQRETDEQDVLDYLGVSGDSVLPLMNARAARDRVLALPWVREATVQKLYPDILEVTIEEHRPFAIWQRGDRSTIIDRSGASIVSSIPERLEGLPHVYGHGAAEQAGTILDALSRHPVLRSRLSVAEYVSLRRWTLHLDNGIAILLPEQGMDRALDDVARMDEREGLLGRDIVAIDLRLADRIVIKLSEDGALRRRAAIRERRGAARPSGGGAV